MGVYNNEVLADSPVVFLTLDEQSGNYTNLGTQGGAITPTGSVSRGGVDRFGNPSGFKVLTDVNTYVGGTVAASTFNDKTFTIEYWIKNPPTSSTNVHGRFAIYSDAGAVVLQTYVTRARAGYGSPYPTYVQFNSATFQANTWHHMVWVADGQFFYLYKDGVYQGYISNNDPFTNVTGGWWMGNNASDAWASGSFVGGEIDDISIYPTALSEERVVAHYNGTGPVAPSGEVKIWSVPL